MPLCDAAEQKKESLPMIYDGEVSLAGATDKELMILSRTKKARIRKKYFDRILRRSGEK